MTVTANRLVSTLPKSPTSQKIIIALKEYWGMFLTEDNQIDLSNDWDPIVRVGDATIPVGKDLMRWNGEEIRLPALTIYCIPQKPTKYRRVYEN